jgi:hypothetical protein
MGKATLVKGSLLRFTPANWSTPQTVRVRGNQDSNSSDQNLSLSVRAAGFRTSEVAVLVRDDDPSAPVIAGGVKAAAVVGLLYEFDFDASGLPPPTFSLLESPEGMVIDPVTGIVTWTPSQIGQFPVRVRAENANGGSNVSFILSVSADASAIRLY